MKKHFFITISCLLFITTVIGQNNANVKQPELNSGSIENQFDYILTQSTRWKEFQLIRKTSLLKVKQHTLDSLRTTQSKLVAASQTTSQYESRINKLQKEVETLSDELKTIAEDKDSISLFGINLRKTSYNLILWSIIVLLILCLIIVIVRFKNSNIITKRSKDELFKTEHEFETFRKKSLKKEQEIMRKLQDEINKNNY